MQEAIIQIGQAVLSKSDLLSSQIQKLNPKRKDKTLHVLKLNFDTKDCRLKLDANEEMDESTQNKYVYVGSADGARAAQWFASSTNIRYFLSETIYNLTQIDFGESLNLMIKKVLENFFAELDEKLVKKYRYALNFKKLGMSSEDVYEIYKELSSNDNFKPADIVSKSQKIFEEYLNKTCNMKLDDIGLFVISIDGECLTDKDEYRQAVIREKTKGKNSKSVKNEKLFCSVCGNECTSSGDLTKMKIKFFTTNQVIFASRLKSYDKSMVLCRDCLNKYMAGETYIMNNLNTRLAGFSVYLIPHFVFGSPMDVEELDRVSENVRDTFNNVTNFNGASDVRNEIINSIDDGQYFLINILFYKIVQKATKVQKLIRDVSPSRFDVIFEGFHEVSEISKKIYGIVKGKNMNLNEVYFLTPVRIKQREPQEMRNLLDIYDAIFTGGKLDKKAIIKNILDVLGIIYYEKQSYNVIPESSKLEFKIMDGCYYIKFLEYIGCLKGENGMDVSMLNVKKDIKNYIETMNYSEEETALFLLGYMIGDVGNKQYQRNQEGKKAVLNKLNFSGIDKSKIVRLTNDIFNKMRQEKILQYNEVTFNECKKLIDAHIKDWHKNKQENLFYILSGYGYSTTRPMLLKGKEENKNE